MKRFLSILITIIIVFMFFFLGFYLANKDEYSTTRSWEKIEKGFIKLDSPSLVKNSSTNIQEDLVASFQEIVDTNNIIKIEKIIEKKVVVQSFVELPINNNQLTPYTVLRVNFDYQSSDLNENNMFLYFFFYKTDDKSLFSNWSLFDIKIESEVNIK